MPTPTQITPAPTRTSSAHLRQARQFIGYTFGRNAGAAQGGVFTEVYECIRTHTNAYEPTIPGLAIMAAGFLGWLAGRALKAAVSRQREFLADARAVQFTRSKDGLGGVLRKAARAQGGAAMPSLHPAVQHMLLVAGGARAHWLDSHPPLAERIRRIYGRAMPTLSDGQKQKLADPWAEVAHKDTGE